MPLKPNYKPNILPDKDNKLKDDMLDSPLRQIIYYARTIISSLILQNLKYCYLVTKLNWMIS